MDDEVNRELKATVFIPTFNGEEYLEELLEAAEKQKTDFGYEILIIDSGSTDSTLEIIKGHPKVRLHQIPNAEFGHGKTRNLAAKMAKGEIVVYLTHDATPANEHWLGQMLAPFSISPEVACVFGKQIPRPNCPPTIKRDIINLFRSFGPDFSIMLQRRDKSIQDRSLLDALTFYSDVNSAARKSILEEMPYKDVDYAEDQAFGRDIIEAGYIKAYTPLGAVIHSNYYGPIDYFRRMYDEFRGLKETTGQTMHVGLRELFGGTIKATLLDWRFIVSDKDYGHLGKLKWLVLAPIYNFGRRFAIRFVNLKRLPRWASFLSLERSLKKQAKD